MPKLTHGEPSGRTSFSARTRYQVKDQILTCTVSYLHLTVAFCVVGGSNYWSSITTWSHITINANCKTTYICIKWKTSEVYCSLKLCKALKLYEFKEVEGPLRLEDAEPEKIKEPNDDNRLKNSKASKPTLWQNAALLVSALLDQMEWNSIEHKPLAKRLIKINYLQCNRSNKNASTEVDQLITSDWRDDFGT